MTRPRILASLDIGTNSTLFLLARIDSAGKIHPLRHDVRTNDLGRGLDGTGNLKSDVMDLNVRLLGEFRKIADDAGAEDIRIAATEALRNAENAQDLINRVKTEHGMDIRVISGQDEADLTYRGILSGLDDQSGRILAADIGGGSSEIIMGEGENILHSVSLPVGAVVLDRLFIRNDPPLLSEVEEVQRHTESALREIPETFAHSEARLLICGGTASSLVAADLGLTEYRPQKIAGHEMTLETLEKYIQRFRTCTLEERRRIPGIGYRRAEIILPGTILIHTLLRTLGRDEYITSERGLRYGLLAT